jgi:hypothetical protein
MTDREWEYLSDLAQKLRIIGEISEWQAKQFPVGWAAAG